MAVIYLIIGGLLKITTAFFVLLIIMSDALLGIVLSGALAVQDMDSVNIGWSVARDTINMFFVIFLLVIAFTTILRIEAYQYKQLLPKLILSILLVNFSRTICSVLIEFSNVLTRAFLNFSQGQETAAGIVALMGISSAWNIDDSIASTSITNLTMALSMLLITIFMGGLAIAFAGLTGMMITRTIALLVLVVLSPIAFGMNVLPVTSSYFKKWWDEFIKYLFYGPIAAFCIYLAAIVAADASTHNTTGFAAEDWTSALNTTPATGLPGARFTQTEFLWEYALVVGLLFLGIGMIKEGGGMGAQIALDFAKKGMMGAGKLVGGYAGKMASRSLARSGTGKIAKALKGSGNKFIRGIGKGSDYLRFLSPKITGEAFKRREAELDRMAYGESSGWAHEKINSAMNRIPGTMKDESGYARMAQSDEVKKEMSRLREGNEAGNSAIYRTELYKALESGDTNKAEATVRLIAEKVNLNDVFGDLTGKGSDDELVKLLHSEDYRKKDEGKHIGEYTGGVNGSIKDMLYHVFGEERGRMLRLDIGEQGKERGEWIDAEGVTFDVKQGKLVDRNEEDQAEVAASEFNKLGADAKNKQSRFSYSNGVRCEDQEVVNEETGKTEIKRVEIPLGGLSRMIAKAMQNGAYGKDEIDRSRFLSAKTRDFINNPEIKNEFKVIIQKQLGSGDPKKVMMGELNRAYLDMTEGKSVSRSAIEEILKKGGRPSGGGGTGGGGGSKESPKRGVGANYGEIDLS